MQLTVPVERSSASASSRICFNDSVGGFSITTFTPASSASIASGPWLAGGVQMTTVSTSPPARASCREEAVRPTVHRSANSFPIGVEVDPGDQANLVREG
jgi:hypothetical protein